MCQLESINNWNGEWVVYRPINKRLKKDLHKKILETKSILNLFLKINVFHHLNFP